MRPQSSLVVYGHCWMCSASSICFFMNWAWPLSPWLLSSPLGAQCPRHALRYNSFGHSSSPHSYPVFEFVLYHTVLWSNTGNITSAKQSLSLLSLVWDDWQGDHWFPVYITEQQTQGWSALFQCSSLVQDNT